MVIQIAIQETQPLTGTASTAMKEPVSFVGWLDMLRAVSELVTTGGNPPGCRQSMNCDLLDHARGEQHLS